MFWLGFLLLAVLSAADVPSTNKLGVEFVIGRLLNASRGESQEEACARHGMAPTSAALLGLSAVFPNTAGTGRGAAAGARSARPGAGTRTRVLRAISNSVGGDFSPTPHVCCQPGLWCRDGAAHAGSRLNCTTHAAEEDGDAFVNAGWFDPAWRPVFSCVAAPDPVPSLDNAFRLRHAVLHAVASPSPQSFAGTPPPTVLLAVQPPSAGNASAWAGFAPRDALASVHGASCSALTVCSGLCAVCATAADCAVGQACAAGRCVHPCSPARDCPCGGVCVQAPGPAEHPFVCAQPTARLGGECVAPRAPFGAPAAASLLLWCRLAAPRQLPEAGATAVLHWRGVRSAAVLGGVGPAERAAVAAVAVAAAGCSGGAGCADPACPRACEFARVGDDGRPRVAGAAASDGLPSAALSPLSGAGAALLQGSGVLWLRATALGPPLATRAADAPATAAAPPAWQWLGAVAALRSVVAADAAAEAAAARSPGTESESGAAGDGGSGVSLGTDATTAGAWEALSVSRVDDAPRSVLSLPLPWGPPGHAASAVVVSPDGWLSSHAFPPCASVAAVAAEACRVGRGHAGAVSLRAADYDPSARTQSVVSAAWRAAGTSLAFSRLLPFDPQLATSAHAKPVRARTPRALRRGPLEGGVAARAGGLAEQSTASLSSASVPRAFAAASVAVDPSAQPDPVPTPPTPSTPRPPAPGETFGAWLRPGDSGLVLFFPRPDTSLAAPVLAEALPTATAAATASSASASAPGAAPLGSLGAWSGAVLAPAPLSGALAGPVRALGDAPPAWVDRLRAAHLAAEYPSAPDQPSADGASSRAAAGPPNATTASPLLPGATAFPPCRGAGLIVGASSSVEALSAARAGCRGPLAPGLWTSGAESAASGAGHLWSVPLAPGAVAAVEQPEERIPVLHSLGAGAAASAPRADGRLPEQRARGGAADAAWALARGVGPAAANTEAAAVAVRERGVAVHLCSLPPPVGCVFPQCVVPGDDVVVRLAAPLPPCARPPHASLACLVGTRATATATVDTAGLRVRCRAPAAAIAGGGATLPLRLLWRPRAPGAAAQSNATFPLHILGMHRSVGEALAVQDLARRIGDDLGAGRVIPILTVTARAPPQSQPESHALAETNLTVAGTATARAAARRVLHTAARVAPALLRYTPSRAAAAADAACSAGCGGSRDAPLWCSHCETCGATPFGPSALRDCMGVCFGDAVVDGCGVCAGGTSDRRPEGERDCSGACFGTVTHCTSPSLPRGTSEPPEASNSLSPAALNSIGAVAILVGVVSLALTACACCFPARDSSTSDDRPDGLHRPRRRRPRDQTGRPPSFCRRLLLQCAFLLRRRFAASRRRRARRRGLTPAELRLFDALGPGAGAHAAKKRPQAKPRPGTRGLSELAPPLARHRRRRHRPSGDHVHSRRAWSDPECDRARSRVAVSMAAPRADRARDRAPVRARRRATDSAIAAAAALTTPAPRTASRQSPAGAAPPPPLSQAREASWPRARRRRSTRGRTRPGRRGGVSALVQSLGDRRWLWARRRSLSEGARARAAYTAVSVTEHEEGEDDTDSEGGTETGTAWGCPICLAVAPGSPITALPCGHAFHHACVRRWFTRARTCPLCKADTGAQLRGIGGGEWASGREGRALPTVL